MSPDLLRRIALECEQIEQQMRMGLPISLDTLFTDLTTEDRQIALSETLELIEELGGSLPGQDEPQKDPLIQGRYRPIKRSEGDWISEEADACLWLAVDEEFYRDVELKEHLPPSRDSEASLARFHHEASMMAKLEHPGILSVYSQGVLSDSRPFYARRWIQPETHQTFLQALKDLERSRKTIFSRSGKIELQSQRDDLLRRLVAACDVIAYAHSNQITHGGLAPSQILLGPYGETFVMSWGFAQKVESVNPDSDIADLGKILKILCSAWEPNKPQSKYRRSSWALALQAVCDKAVSGSPEGRYSSVRHFAQDLERVLRNETPAAWRAPWIYRISHWVDRHRSAASFGTLIMMICIPAFMVMGGSQNRHNRQLRIFNENQKRSLEAENAFRKQAVEQASRANAREQLVIEAIASFRNELLKSPDLIESSELENLRWKLSQRPIDLFWQLVEADPTTKITLPSELRFLMIESQIAQRIAQRDSNPNVDHEPLNLPDPKTLNAMDTLGIDLMLDRYCFLLGNSEPNSHSISQIERIIGWYQDTLATSNLPPISMFAQQKRYYLANAWYQCATSLDRLGDRERSAQVHQKALEIREGLYREQPDIIKHQRAIEQSRQAILHGRNR
jgi:serine/threonine protein kinase